MHSNTAEIKSLNAPRLVRTAHSPEKDVSIITQDEKIAPFHPLGPKLTGFTVFDARDSLPVNNTELFSTDGVPNAIPRCPPNGLFIGTADFKPGAQSPMHRTLSIDYAVIMSGEITVRLDGGEETALKTGDFLVQQGANHQWFNHTDQMCRIVFICAGADKLVGKDGKPLEP